MPHSVHSSASEEDSRMDTVRADRDLEADTPTNNSAAPDGNGDGIQDRPNRDGAAGSRVRVLSHNLSPQQLSILTPAQRAMLEPAYRGSSSNQHFIPNDPEEAPVPPDFVVDPEAFTQWVIRGSDQASAPSLEESHPPPARPRQSSDDNFQNSEIPDGELEGYGEEYDGDKSSDSASDSGARNGYDSAGEGSRVRGAFRQELDGGSEQATRNGTSSRGPESAGDARRREIEAGFRYVRRTPESRGNRGP